MTAFLRFGLVGTLGFLCDAGLLTLLLRMGTPALAGRPLSIAVAVAVTFVLNRAFTFAAREAPVQVLFGRYVLVSAVGAGVNYVVFAIGLAVAPALWAMAGGSAAALAVNFVGSRDFAFRHPRCA